MHVSTHVHTYICMHVYVDVLDACPWVWSLLGCWGECCMFFTISHELKLCRKFSFHFSSVYCCTLCLPTDIRSAHTNIHMYVCMYIVYRRFYFTLRFMADSCVAFVGHCVFQFVLPLALSYVCMSVHMYVCMYVHCVFLCSYTHTMLAYINMAATDRTVSKWHCIQYASMHVCM